MKILLLGSNGFIGRGIGLNLEKIHELRRINRDTSLFDLFTTGEEFDFIINCASSTASADSKRAKENNFSYPSTILRNVRTRHWVQIESYFQLQIPMGRRDAYTIEKQKFSHYLEKVENSRLVPSIHHLYLPHVFGEGERPERLIASAISSFRNFRPLETSSGSQQLPILHISDAVLGITKFLESPNKSAACTPFWYGSVKQLIELIGSQFPEVQVMHGRKADPIDSNFPKVEFPKAVENWVPQMQLDEFLKWVRTHGNR